MNISVQLFVMPEKVYTHRQTMSGDRRGKESKRSDVQGEVSRETVWLRECREMAEGIEWQNTCRIGELEKISPDLEKLDTRRANKWLDLTESQVVKDLKGRHKYKQGFFFWKMQRKEKISKASCAASPLMVCYSGHHSEPWGIMLCLDKRRSIH